MGTGHVMRCLALAQGWKSQGGQVTFITVNNSEGLLQRFLDEGFEVVTLERPYPDRDDWEITSQVLAAYSDAWVVIDGYNFDPTYQLLIKEMGHKLLVVDDIAHLAHYHADVVLNQNISADRLHYSCEPYTRLLLGTSYALLRSEFLEWAHWRRDHPETGRKILVTLGGADPINLTLQVLQALKLVDVSGLETQIVVGPVNPHIDTLRQEIESGVSSFQLVIESADMPQLMAWADIAINAGGSTCWELCCLGVPMIIMVTSQDQALIGSGLEWEGCAKNLGRWDIDTDVARFVRVVEGLLEDSDNRSAMSSQGQMLVDGRGAERVVDSLMTLSGNK